MREIHEPKFLRCPCKVEHNDAKAHFQQQQQQKRRRRRKNINKYLSSFDLCYILGADI